MKLYGVDKFSNTQPYHNQGPVAGTVVAVEGSRQWPGLHTQ